MELNERIKSLRKSLKATQTAFGALFGLSNQVISDIERGESKPSNTFVKFLEFRYGLNFGLEEPKSGPESTNSESWETRFSIVKEADMGSYGIPDLGSFQVTCVIEGENIETKITIKNEEFEFIKILRELDPDRRDAIYIVMADQLNTIIRAKAYEIDERKKKLFKNSLRIISNAIGEP
jgi:transcriptional regulator with XRE-family HTH domain